MCWLLTVPILVNKDVRKPIFNDLKFPAAITFSPT